MTRTIQDVYFIVLEEDGLEYFFNLYAYIFRERSASGHYLAYVLEPDSEEIIFFDCATELATLRTRLDETIRKAGEIVFCYRSEFEPHFEWYPVN